MTELMCTHSASDFAFLHGFQCLADRVSDLDTSFLELLRRCTQSGILFYARCQLFKKTVSEGSAKCSPTDQHTLARSYASRARFMASESWNFSTSPWSCFTLSCSSRFFLSSSFSTSTNVANGDLGGSLF